MIDDHSALLERQRRPRRPACRFPDVAGRGRAGTSCACKKTRCDAEQLPAEMRQPPGYHAFWHGSARKKGYSGTALLARTAPEAVRFGLG